MNTFHWPGGRLWYSSWWHYKMETFSVLLTLCVRNSPVTGEFTTQRPVTQSFDASLICAWTNGWGRRWFEMPSHPIWRHCNANVNTPYCIRFESFLFVLIWLSFSLCDQGQCNWTMAYTSRNMAFIFAVNGLNGIGFQKPLSAKQFKHQCW